MAILKSKTFDLITFITVSGNSFYEAAHFDEIKEHEKADYLGYFNKYTDCHINDCGEGKYLICYISSHDDFHKVIKANDKFELITSYNKLIKEGQDEAYINIFNLNDLVYLKKSITV